MKSSLQVIQNRLQQHIVFLFDWDNMIMASGKWVNSVYAKTTKDLEAKNILLKSGAEIPQIPTGTTEEILDSLFGKINLEISLKIYNQNYNQMYKAEALKMLSGAKEMLQLLDNLSYHSTQHIIVHAAIVTSHHRPGIEEHFQIRKELLQLNENHKIFVVGKTCVSKPKPDIESALLVLKEFNLCENLPITSFMFGDGVSDMDFAKNLDLYLRQKNPNSSCTGILYNSLLSGDVIFSEKNFAEEALKYVRKKTGNLSWENKLLDSMKKSTEPFTEERLKALQTQSEIQAEIKELPWPHHVACGYAGVFKRVYHAVNSPSTTVTPDKLSEVKLKQVATKNSDILEIAKEQYLEDRNEKGMYNNIMKI